MAGRPRKILTDVVPSQMTHQKIHHIFRAISIGGRGSEYDADPLEDVEAYVESWLIKGYQLILVQHLRTERVEGSQPVAEQMLYVLYKP